MLTYILALAVGFGSLGLYLTAFFLPEVHRKNDFYWSGVGLFYALTLWVCAGRITGGVLLGQIAAVTVLGWFGWQILALRRQLLPPEQQTALPNQEEAIATIRTKVVALKDSLQSKLSNLSLPENASQWPEKATGLFNKAKDQIQGLVGTVAKRGQTKAKTTPAPAKPGTVTSTTTISPIPTTEEEAPESEGEVIAASGATPEVIETAPTPPTGKASPFEAIAKDIESTTTKPAAPKPSITLDVEATPEAVSPESETPELIPPHPPKPELVQEAVEDAEAKNIPASPPAAKKPKKD